MKANAELSSVKWYLTLPVFREAFTQCHLEAMKSALTWLLECAVPLHPDHKTKFLCLHLLSNRYSNFWDNTYKPVYWRNSPFKNMLSPSLTASSLQLTEYAFWMNLCEKYKLFCFWLSFPSTFEKLLSIPTHTTGIWALAGLGGKGEGKTGKLGSSPPAPDPYLSLSWKHFQLISWKHFQKTRYYSDVQLHLIFKLCTLMFNA